METSLGWQGRGTVFPNTCSLWALGFRAQQAQSCGSRGGLHCKLHLHLAVVCTCASRPHAVVICALRTLRALWSRRRPTASQRS